MENTQGFYKYEDNKIQYTPTCIMTSEYVLVAEAHEDNTYPVDGWYWFDSDGEAYSFFGIANPLAI